MSGRNHDLIRHLDLDHLDEFDDDELEMSQSSKEKIHRHPEFRGTAPRDKRQGAQRREKRRARIDAKHGEE